ncbi:MAG TPA: hypothetical protein VHW00_16820 [Thermoanaerobaculia bacterium]|nr:hypothetical protein [Thermoanaerobaculia bacterium]
MMRRLSLALLFLLAACATRPRAPHDLPRGEVWVAHLENDLAPFWTMPDALGDPIGNFPTFRCNDGRRWDPARPCDDLLEAGSWISENLDRDYVRMQSRQTYFYGVAYHLTGDPKMLALAKAGAQWIRANVDRVNGGAVSFRKHGVADAPPGARTTQDLAYAQLGLAMTYYLTRDPALLDDILFLKQHIFRAYDDGSGLLLWVREGDDAKRRELVAQLDQVNAYMLLLAPILPEPHRREWLRDLERLADGMVERYWSPELNLFRGTIHDPLHSGIGTRHTDFGHTSKALWMIERIGRLTHRDDLVSFATTHARPVLAQAWDARNGCWATGHREDGTLDRMLVWWSFAELDQLSATLALRDPSFAERLPASTRCWFDKLVDHQQHEVWGFVDPDDPSKHFAKAHLWKNGYHSAEHALVSYLTAQELHARPSTLWFAFDATRATARPYLFDGRFVRAEKSDRGTKVTFTRLR